MKALISSKELRSKLKIASQAIPSRPTYPALGHILIESNRETQQVSFTGFDLTTGIRTWAIAQVEDSGSIALPSELLNNIVARLPEDDLLTLATLDDLTVQIKSENAGEYEIQGLATEDYPKLPDTTKQETYLCLPKSFLFQGIDSSVPFASTDKFKQPLTGVRFQHREGELEFAATDGYRLSVRTIVPAKPKTELELPNFAVTIPAQSLRNLGQAIRDGDDEITVSLDQDQRQIVFSWRDGMLTSCLQQNDNPAHQYPNYHQIIPSQFSTVGTVNCHQLIAALERIFVLARKKPQHHQDNVWQWEGRNYGERAGCRTWTRDDALPGDGTGEREQPNDCSECSISTGRTKGNKKTLRLAGSSDQNEFPYISRSNRDDWGRQTSRSRSGSTRAQIRA